MDTDTNAVLVGMIRPCFCSKTASIAANIEKKTFGYKIVSVTIYQVTGQVNGPGRGSNDAKATSAPWARDVFEEEVGQTYNLVFYKYNPRARPPQKYVNVTLELTLLHIRYLDMLRRELQTVVGMEMTWHDSRLAWIPGLVYQIMANSSSVWTPDLVVLNSALPTKSLLPNRLRIKQDGTVAWTRRESINLALSILLIIVYHKACDPFSQCISLKYSDPNNRILVASLFSLRCRFGA
ncbi:acetylcholine receptor protein [Plakobranchus ocellatus]|uniref:Acetylcholine receptor protein n=1 Tax=Plakobranchus ocellatus TaxID=259542 RepID=A0AAV4A3I4_9GAST|nr:acetylcholine receptor protein [Plakobranchus ocellatus]